MLGDWQELFRRLKGEGGFHEGCFLREDREERGAHDELDDRDLAVLEDLAEGIEIETEMERMNSLRKR